MPLDPHVRRLVSALTLRGQAPADLAGRRAAFAGLMRMAADDADRRATVRDIAGPVPLRLYDPPGAPWPSPGLIWLHGGGFVCGNLDTHDGLCRTLAIEGGCRVIAVGYRLAPEHCFPAALEDAVAATAHVFAQARALGIDPARVAVGGDSAGGTLAAALARRLAAQAGPKLALHLLLCPILDWAADPAGRASAGPGYVLDGASMTAELAAYLPAGTDPRHPDISPLRATGWSGLPPALVHTAECDPLRAEGAAYAARLAAAGVAVRHTCHHGMIHLFYAFSRLVPYARAALRDLGADLQAGFAGSFASVAAPPRSV